MSESTETLARWHAFYRPETGELAQVASFAGPTDGVCQALGVQSVEITHAQAASVDGVCYVQDGELIVAGRLPAHHKWNWAMKQFEPDVPVLVAAKRKAIEVERDARIFAPVIVYDGKNLDADAKSLERLGNKLMTTGIQLALGDQPPVETLVWRDADNITHSFPDLAAYRAWLEGFALALDARGTAAFGWSWQKKAQLEALITVEDIQAFDPTS